MTKEIAPFKYSGSLTVPSSKSYLQRAIAISGLADGTSTIIGLTKSDDAKAALGIIQEFGSKIEVIDNEVIVEGSIDPKSSVEVYCGEAGLSTRMFSPIAAGKFNDVTITGSGSILTRPMDMVIDALEQLGASVESNDGYLPLRVKGCIQAGEITIDGSESSQLLTGLLIALPTLDGDSIINVLNLKSIPYVQMTLDILESFGIDIEHEDFKIFRIKGNQKPKACTYNVEGDWSGASFHVVGAAISGDVLLNGLHAYSAQADRAILDVVELAGAKVEWRESQVYIAKGELKGFEFDATDCPDLFPPIAVLACCCKGTTRITGTDRLAHKESDRAKTIQSELKKLGVEVTLKPNVMEINGCSVSGGTISSRNDHRIAMMGAILATVSEGPISIENPMAVNKSYPAFYQDLNKL